mmetsp:Transcript_21501/g.46938  ORF Transcript_21501/g.46938 Transcript_21501/m.46938 type:complete len:226 (+) Transcript_21501:338-1015(+)
MRSCKRVVSLPSVPMPMVWRLTLTVAVALSFLAGAADGFIVGAFKRVEKDFLSLTRRVTARHILLPDEEVARVLKQKIRDECIDKDLWVIDAFEEAAKKYSRDETTNFRGGLIGELAPQGYCRSPELDRFQFSVALGEMVGPLETDYGYHLLLVSERTNCPKLDGDTTLMIQTRGDDVFGTLSQGKQVGRVNVPELVLDQVKFWCLTLIAGGIVAELSEKLVANL